MGIAGDTAHSSLVFSPNALDVFAGEVEHVFARVPGAMASEDLIHEGLDGVLEDTLLGVADHVELVVRGFDDVTCPAHEGAVSFPRAHGAVGEVDLSLRVEDELELFWGPVQF